MLKLDINILFTIINLLVLYLLMKKFLFSPVNTILDKRKNMLEQQYADASLAKDNALIMKDEYENTLKSARDLSEQIVAEAKICAKAEYDRRVKEANEDAAKILENAKQSIKLERSEALLKMKDEIAELAIAAATKIIAENNTAESNQKLYDQFCSRSR